MPDRGRWGKESSDSAQRSSQGFSVQEPALASEGLGGLQHSPAIVHHDDPESSLRSLRCVLLTSFKGTGARVNPF